MTRQTIVTIAVTGPVEALARPWIWEVDAGHGDYRTGLAATADDAWAEARRAATSLTGRLETAGHQLRDAIGGDQ